MDPDDLIPPATFITAKDHSDWNKLNQVQDSGGLGFDVHGTSTSIIT